MSEFSNTVGKHVDLSEASLTDIVNQLVGMPISIQPDRIRITPAGLELQRQRGEALGIPGARQMGPQELFDAMMRLL